MFVNIIKDNTLTSEEGSNRKIEQIIQWGTAQLATMSTYYGRGFKHVARLKLGNSSRKNLFLNEVTHMKTWSWPPLLYYCGNTCNSERLYVASVTGEGFRSTSTHTDFFIVRLTIAKSRTPPVRSEGSLSWHAQARIYWCASWPSTIWSTGPTKNRKLSVLPGSTHIRISSVYQARPKTTYHMCY